MKSFKILSISLLLLQFSIVINAKTYLVSSKSEFSSAQSLSVAGDTIIWQQGVYTDISLSVSSSNLTILAEVPGRTIFTGASKIFISGSNNVIDGFQYLNGNIGTDVILQTSGSNNHFTRLNFQGYYSSKYVVFNAGTQYNKLSYSNLQSRTFLGDKNILSILVDENIPGYHTIQYCSFKDFEGTGGDAGIEPIRIGLSSQAQFISRSIVEYCYFTQCNGDGEIISNKSRQNVFRYNTFYDNPYSELVLRHGNECIVYGNFFLNGYGGVRIKEGQGYYIYNNYFSDLNSRSIELQNYSADPLDSLLIAYNTIVNSAIINLGGTGSYAPTNVTFANNIFANPTGKILFDPTGTENWIGNISHGALGITPPDGIIDIDPNLTINDDGFYELQEGSAAIDAATADYPPLLEIPDIDTDPNILLDLLAQERPAEIALKDVGCTEYTQGIGVKPHVTDTNTGPAYLRTEELVFLDVNVVGEGNVVLDPPSGVYLLGAKVLLTAEPEGDYEFSFWTGGLSSLENPDTILMNSDKSVTAFFQVKPVSSTSTTSLKDISFYPNPVQDLLTVAVNQSTDLSYEFSIFDITGSKVFDSNHKSLNLADNNFTIDVSNLASGTYFIHIYQSTTSPSQQINKINMQESKFVKL